MRFFSYSSTPGEAGYDLLVMIIIRTAGAAAAKRFTRFAGNPVTAATVGSSAGGESG